jgi:hypothetical protein
MNPGRPTAEITIDGKSLTAVEAGLLRLSMGMTHGTHYAAEMWLWPGSKFAGTSVGAPITIALGTDDDNEDVLTGEIAAAGAGPSAVKLEGISATVALSRTRKSQTYLSQTVSDIVNDLASDVDIDEVSAGLTLSAYSVDQRRTVWAHLVELAALAGADLGCAASGGLRFVLPAAGPGGLSYRYGATVLDWRLANLMSPPVPKIVPNGAASEQGSDRWHWLLHDPVGGSADPTRIVAAFHTRDAADALAKTLEERAGRTAMRGTMRISGDAALRPGEVIEVDNLPGPAAGPFRVLGVRHTFDARHGFYTDAFVEGAGGGGGFPI